VKRLGEALEAWVPGSGTWCASDPVVLLGAAWPELVGEDVARNSHPIRLTGTVLTIVTHSSAWSQQLSLLSERILAAIEARLPSAGIAELRFRVGRIPAPRAVPAGRSPRRGPAPARALRVRAATAGEALARFKESVTERQRAKRAAGWKECRGCEALIAPDGAVFCAACARAQAEDRATATARLLFEAPWLGYRGTAALVEGLTPPEYDAIRRRLLTAWWRVLDGARKAQTLSRGGRERAIASSYVVLKSELPPDDIQPAMVRNVLGDELHELLYGTER
jgi:hypothetical protein